LILAALACAGLRASSSAISSTADPLTPSSAITIHAAGGEERVFDVRLPPDAVMELTIVEQQGMAGVVSVTDANGVELVLVDIARRQPAARRLLLPPESTQVHLRP